MSRQRPIVLPRFISRCSKAKQWTCQCVKCKADRHSLKVVAQEFINRHPYAYLSIHGQVLKPEVKE